MKKKWALLLAAVMALQPLAALNVSAVEVTGVYADVYGLEIEFATNIDDTDYADLALTCNGEDVALQTPVADGKKLTVAAEELLSTDTPYTLTVGGTEKIFQIKTVFEEDFDDLTDADIDSTTEYSNDYGTYSISNGGKGSFVKDGEVYVTDGALTISALDTNINLANTTLMADVRGYAKNWETSSGSFKAPTLAQVNIHIYSRVGTTIEKAAGIRLKRSNFTVGTADSVGEYGPLSSTVEYPEKTLADGTTNTKFDFGEFTPEPEDTDSDDDIIVDTTNTVALESNEHAVALRTNGAAITGFVGTSVAPYKTETETETEEFLTTAGKFSLGAAPDARGVAVFDNVKITAYTENVTPVPDGAPIVTGLEDNNYQNLVLSFDKNVEWVGPLSLATIQVFKNEEETPMTITSIEVDSQDKTKLNILPEGYVAGNTYTVVVPEGFGAPGHKTEEDQTETVTVNTTAIEIESTVLKPSNIEITFNTNVEDITDATDLAYVTVEKGDINGENFAIDASATIAISENVMTIEPLVYDINNTYKVTILNGFGNENIFLDEEGGYYEYSQLFEKILVEMKNFTGNKGFIEVEFDTPLETTTTATDIDIEIRYAEDVINDEGVKTHSADDPITAISPSITEDGKLRVEIPSMVRDEVYEIYIPEGFGTNVVATDREILKKFSLKTIAFENFDGDGESFGGLNLGTALVSDPGTSNNKRAYNSVSKAETVFTNDEAKALENLTFELDYQILYPVDKAGTYKYEMRDKYFTFDSFMFNCTPTPTAGKYNGVSLAIKEHALVAGTEYYNDNQTWALTGEPSYLARYDYTVHGDSYKGTTIYQPGDAFPTSIEVTRNNGERVFDSEREWNPGTHLEFVKTGSSISVTRGGEFLATYEAQRHTAKKGEIRFNVGGAEYMTFDNVRISTIKLIEEENVVASNLTSNLVLGGDGKSTQEAITGSFTLKNYTDGIKPIRAVVVAYGEHNEMLCANMVTTDDVDEYGDPISLTQMLPGETKRTLTFDLDNTVGTKSIKLFLWNDLTNKTKIMDDDFPTS